MKNNNASTFMIQLFFGIILSLSSIANSQQLNEGSLPNKKANENTTQKFVDHLPEEIECVDIGYLSQKNGSQPSPANELCNNILPNWDYCLAAYYRGNISKDDPSVSHDQYDQFILVLTASTLPLGVRPKNKTDILRDGKIGNPLPSGLNDLKIAPDLTQWNHIQQDVGQFFCSYLVKLGDIIPFADDYYYVDKPFHIKKLSVDSNNKFYRRRPGSLAIPLVTQHHEIASESLFSYLPGLTLCVTRIYLIPGPDDFVNLWKARICTVRSSDIEQVWRSESQQTPIGFPKLVRQGDVTTETMQVQELTVGDVIKGESVGYRIVSIKRRTVTPTLQQSGIPEDLRCSFIGCIEIDPTPIPLDENGEPIERK